VRVAAGYVGDYLLLTDVVMRGQASRAGLQ